MQTLQEREIMSHWWSHLVDQSHTNQQVYLPSLAEKGFSTSQVADTLPSASITLSWLNHNHLDINSSRGDFFNLVSSTTQKQSKEKMVGESGGEKRKEGVRKRARRQRPVRTFGERSSQFRGVSRYRYTGRYEAFLWDNTDPKGKAKTVYVGVFDEEEAAARAYDLAALKFWGASTPTNFPVSEYKSDMEEMQKMSKKEYLLSIRRRSKCFSKGASIYRGVSRNTDYTKWQARVGRGHGMRGIYLGTFETEEAAARAYDIALIRFKGTKAVTNFDMNQYDVVNILSSDTLPIGKGASRLLKKASVSDVISRRMKERSHGTSGVSSVQPNGDQRHSSEEPSGEGGWVSQGLGEGGMLKSSVEGGGHCSSSAAAGRGGMMSEGGLFVQQGEEEMLLSMPGGVWGGGLGVEGEEEKSGGGGSAGEKMELGWWWEVEEEGGRGMVEGGGEGGGEEGVMDLASTWLEYFQYEDPPALLF